MIKKKKKTLPAFTPVPLICPVCKARLETVFKLCGDCAKFCCPRCIPAHVCEGALNKNV